MTAAALDQARTYVKQSLASQRRLGYRARVSDEVIESAVADTARAVAKLLRANRPAA
jgi:hypothetical protein